MRLTILLALLPTLALAQSPTPHPEALGTVTGHIICADTRRPARLASVSLLPAKDRNGPPWGAETDMDGAYRIRDVPPGVYYFIVQLPGYIAPALDLGLQLHALTPEAQRRVQQELQTITVAPRATTRADATLHLGASISGTVRYDDGSPASTINVGLERRNAKSGSFDVIWHVTTTDGQGRFRLESLAPGEYIIRATLQSHTDDLRKSQTSDGKPIETIVSTSLFLSVYSGDVFRSRDAAVIKVDDGEETPGAEITLPLSELHSVSGTVTAKDGHAINSCALELLFSDTQEVLTCAGVADDGTFRFTYIPEGSYILKIESPRDVSRIQTGIGPDGFRIEDRTDHSYGDNQQPLIVQTDIQSLNFTVPDKPTPSTPSE
jgi:hypothetical protein